MNIVNRLKVLSFLQYFIWGSWLTTFSSYMIDTLHFSGAEVGLVYSANGIAALFMPSLIGIIADKWIPANRVFMICHLICAVVLFYTTSISDAGSMFVFMLLNAMLFIPTIALLNSISYFCLEQNHFDTVSTFPKIRIYGTIGFIVAMWSVSLLGFELSNMQLYLAAGSSVLIALFSMLLPKVSSSKKEKKKNWAETLGLDAFVLFKQPKMIVFFIFAILLGATLQISNTFSSPYLHDFSLLPEYQDSLIVKYPSILLSVSQMAEVFCLLLIPFFLRKYGIKRIMIISMVAWSLRFILLAFGDPSPFGFMLLLIAMLVYGCAFDFFNISGSLFIETETNSDIRASAQGLFMTMVNGFGAYFGSVISGHIVDYFTVNGTKNWTSIWLVFAVYALMLAVIFVFSFKYKHEPERFKADIINH
ncbi:nucleoside permease [Bacillus sp. FJAT-27264]|uniref:MFS transporter n=1 Tax=Paenibacillus agri TaxID=2744309 RepID=A0A850EMQ7_9BACL|nr:MULTISPECIES: nucleoside permease [Bacillales]NUU62305.1 MFS transporter [Paenibacillus agri]OBZ19201.1 nucleoside permease [Bacillus sp. FJAT-27264]